MELTELIAELERKHCGSCKVGKAIAAMKELVTDSGNPVFDPPKLYKPKSIGAPGPNGEKACKKCGKMKPIGEFPKNGNCLGGHTHECNQCRRMRQNAAYHKRNSGKPALTIAKPTEESEPEFPKNCSLCNMPCSTQGRLESHMEKVHGR